MFDPNSSLTFPDELLSVFQVSGLKYGAKYNYRVFAENAAGVSKPTSIIGPLLADDPHGEAWGAVCGRRTVPRSLFTSQHASPAFPSGPDL